MRKAEHTVTQIRPASAGRPQAPAEAALVSVVIPTHNRAARLVRAIASVQRQTYGVLEIIVVDDHSQDDTREAVAHIEDPRIRYMRHECNLGGSAARNTGIRAATGEYIAFLDDDDEWQPHKTEEQLRVLRSYDVVCCTCDAIGDELAKVDGKREVAFEDLLQGKGTFGGTGVLMARARVLKEVMFDESLPRYQDWDLFLRIASKHRIAYLNKPLLRSDSGDHLRITNSILRVPARALEAEFGMLHKHRAAFGEDVFRHHMCRSLLYGFGRRPDRLQLLACMVRRYGLASVIHVLLARGRIKLGRASARPSLRRSSSGSGALRDPGAGVK